MDNLEDLSSLKSKSNNFELIIKSKKIKIFLTIMILIGLISSYIYL